LVKDFNLLAATYRKRENDCISELWYFARKIGDKRLEAGRTGLPSLVVAKTSLDPVEFSMAARSAILENPWVFRYLLKLTPIQRNTEADLDSIVKTALELAGEGLRPGETYKVEARVRLNTMSRDEIIEAVASRIDNRVDLENPDKVVLVEVIGEKAGVSVIPPEAIVSVERLRREARRRASQARRGPGGGPG